MKEPIKNVLSDYSIGEILKVEPINNGNTSNALYVLSANGRWVLRTLKDKNQGISEYVISDILANDNICSKIIANRYNNGYSYFEGNYYNLQKYVQPEPIKDDIETFAMLGRSLGILHSKINNNVDLIEQVDRFSLQELWKQTKSKWNNVEKYLDYFSFKSSDFERLVNETITYENIKKTFIHGDLGKWNLIYSSEKIYIIDFGEVRRGDNHLDIAAALTSMINFDLGIEFTYECLNAFYKTYINYMDNFQWQYLQKNIQLWILRGIFALVLYSNKESSFIERVKKMIDLKMNFDAIILKSFI